MTSPGLKSPSEGGGTPGEQKTNHRKLLCSLLGPEVSPPPAPLGDPAEREWQRPGRQIAKVIVKLEQCDSQGLRH